MNRSCLLNASEINTRFTKLAWTYSSFWIPCHVELLTQRSSNTLVGKGTWKTPELLALARIVMCGGWVVRSTEKSEIDLTSSKYQRHIKKHAKNGSPGRFASRISELFTTQMGVYWCRSGHRFHSMYKIRQMSSLWSFNDAWTTDFMRQNWMKAERLWEKFDVNRFLRDHQTIARAHDPRPHLLVYCFADSYNLFSTDGNHFKIQGTAVVSGPT